MQVSPSGIDFIKANEGCVLRAYQDGGGVWTIGVGHTGGVKPHDKITQEQADALLRLDLGYAQKCVNEHALPCNQNQFDALVDFVFNIGPSQFLTSTLLRLHKAGNYDKAAAEFPNWKYDNGKIVPGLIKRREKERALYSRPVSEEVH